MLYQSDVGGLSAPEVFSAFDLIDYSRAEEHDMSEAASRSALALDQLEIAFGYAKTLVEGTLGRRDEIDRLVSEQAENWRLERMPAVDRNILRLAVFELMAEEDVPKLVVLDEAIELAKRYGSDQSGAFVNGVLDGLLKRHAFPGRMT